jgi:hypothetical protein
MRTAKAAIVATVGEGNGPVQECVDREEFMSWRNSWPKPVYLRYGQAGAGSMTGWLFRDDLAERATSKLSVGIQLGFGRQYAKPGKAAIAGDMIE